MIVEYHAAFEDSISLGSIADIARQIATAFGFPGLDTEITGALGASQQRAAGRRGRRRRPDGAEQDHRPGDQHPDGTYGVGLALDFTQLPPATRRPYAARHRAALARLQGDQGQDAATHGFMTEPDPGGNPPGRARTEFELLASLQVFGVRADASATFGSGLDTILAVRFGNLTLGEVLTYLVSKAEPGLNFQLTPPWDLLNDINLQQRHVRGRHHELPGRAQLRQPGRRASR